MHPELGPASRAEIWDRVAEIRERDGDPQGAKIARGLAEENRSLVLTYEQIDKNGRKW